jgi:hypothetical protein
MSATLYHAFAAAVGTKNPKFGKNRLSTLVSKFDPSQRATAPKEIEPRTVSRDFGHYGKFELTFSVSQQEQILLALSNRRFDKQESDFANITWYEGIWHDAFKAMSAKVQAEARKSGISTSRPKSQRRIEVLHVDKKES